MVARLSIRRRAVYSKSTAEEKCYRAAEKIAHRNTHDTFKESNMKTSQRLFIGLACLGFALTSVSASADTLQLKDGRVIQGRFLGGTQASVQFEENGKIDLYDVGQVISITFTGGPSAPSATQTAPPAAVANNLAASAPKSASGVTVPAGTSLLVRTIDSVDSDKNHVGDRFRASLEQDLSVDGVVVAPRGADVYGRLAEAKESGHFEGKSQLKLELTDI